MMNDALYSLVSSHFIQMPKFIEGSMFLTLQHTLTTFVLLRLILPNKQIIESKSQWKKKKHLTWLISVSYIVSSVLVLYMK